MSIKFLTIFAVGITFVCAMTFVGGYRIMQGAKVEEQLSQQAQQIKSLPLQQASVTPSSPSVKTVVEVGADQVEMGVTVE